MVGKKGQFFILAAVILSAVIISLGLVSNSVRVNREPENFYDTTYEVKKESGELLDYEIYQGFADDENLEDFVDKYAKDLRDQDPDSNFVFIYSDGSDVTLKNYGVDDAGDVKGGGSTTLSSISFYGVNTDEEQNYDEYNNDAWTKTLSQDEIGDIFTLSIKEQEYDFPLSDYKQVIFIREKEVNNESFVDIQ